MKITQMGAPPEGKNKSANASSPEAAHLLDQFPAFVSVSPGTSRFSLELWLSAHDQLRTWKIIKLFEKNPAVAEHVGRWLNPIVLVHQKHEGAEHALFSHVLNDRVEI